MKRVVLVCMLTLTLALPAWAGTIVIDDKDPGCKLSGTWADNMGKNPEGKMFGGEGCVHGDYHYTSVHGAYRKTGREKATWTPNLPKAGKYKVEVTFRRSENRSKKVTYEVVHSGGREKKIVNQAATGKETLGIFSFSAGSEGCVELVSDGGGSASADSAQFTYVGEGGGSDDSGTSSLGDLIGGSKTDSGDGALVNLTDGNPGEKQVTLSSDGKLEAKVLLRTYGSASLKVAVNGETWITWSRANDSDSTPCEADGKTVEGSIIMEKPGDPSGKEVSLSKDVKAGDILKASLEGDFGGGESHVVIQFSGQASGASGPASRTPRVQTSSTSAQIGE